MDKTRNMLPFYLLVDVSWSMMDEGKVDAANRIVPELVDVLIKNPIISDKIRFSLIDFAGAPQVIIPLGDLLDLDLGRLPRLECRMDGTHYANAFNSLKAIIRTDVDQLKADGFKVHRPAVFFVTDGEPNDDTNERERAFTDLTVYDNATKTGNLYYPNFIPFAIDRADGKALLKFVHPPNTMKLFLQAEGSTPGQAIAGLAQVLIKSVVESGQQGRFELDTEDVQGVVAVSPDEPPGDWI